MTNPSPRCTVFLTLAAVFTTWICERCFAQNSNVVPDRAVAWRQNALNRTPGSKFLSKVEEVKKLLSDAEGYYSSGRYDLAFKKYEQVLNLDPYNVAARRGEEKITNAKYHYGENAYNETRARQLWKVEKAWEEPVHKYGMAAAPVGVGFARDTG